MIYLALVGLAFAVNYPGRLNPDSISQLVQINHPELLDDWIEPWTLECWRLFSSLLGEPASALLVQCLILFVYPSMLISRAIAGGNRSARVWIPLGLFTVSLIEVSGQIIRDALLLGFILCFVAVLDDDRGWRSWRTLLVLPPIIAVSLIRPFNPAFFGFAAALALLVYRVRWRRALPAFLLVLAVCASLVLFIKFFDQTVLKASHSHADSSVMIFDVAGISANSHTDLFAGIPRWPRQTLPKPWDCYKSYYWDPFIWGKCHQYYDLFNARAPDRYGFWIHAIVSHPRAYMLHRARYLYQILRSPAPIASFGTPYATNSAGTRNQMFGLYTYGFDMRDKYQLWHPNIVSRLAEWIAALVFSRLAGLAEIAACFLAACLAVRKGPGTIDRVSLAAAGIGVANMLLMALFGVAAMGRYLLPTYACGLLILMTAVMSPLPRRFHNLRPIWKADSIPEGHGLR